MLRFNFKNNRFIFMFAQMMSVKVIEGFKYKNYK